MEGKVTISLESYNILMEQLRKPRIQKIDSVLEAEPINCDSCSDKEARIYRLKNTIEIQNKDIVRLSHELRGAELGIQELSLANDDLQSEKADLLEKISWCNRGLWLVLFCGFLLGGALTYIALVM
jgi:hypothetical protein